MSHDTPQTSERVAVLTLIGMAAAVGSSLVVGSRIAVLIMAAACAGGALARILLPVESSFAVRRRAVDVTIMVSFAVGLGFLGLTAPLS